MGLFSKAAREGRAKNRQQQEEQKERKRLFKMLCKEVDYYGSKIIKVAFNRGYRQVLRGILEPGFFDVMFGNGTIRHLKFTHVLMDEWRLWFRIDAGDLPGINLAALRDEEFIYDLSRALNKTVRYEGTPKSGDFIIVERDSGISGIPTYLSMQKAFAWIPANADPLTFCAGQAENNSPLIVSLTQLPHLLVAGTTRSGKSVNINNMVCTFAARNDPDVIKMAMIDLKSGLEFGLYENMPHLLATPGTKTDGIAFNEAEAKIVLNAVIGEMQSRGAKLGAAGARNIEEYNRMHPDQRIPYLVPIIDELSLLLFNMDSEIKKMGRVLMNTVLATGAAYGIHVVACTQDPTREIVPRHLRANLPGRICFRTTSIASSIAVLENKHAHRLAPKGRGIFQFDDEIMFQGPYISGEMVKRHVKRVIQHYRDKPGGESIKGLGLRDLLLYALEQRNGSLAWEPLATEFAPKGLSADSIKTLIKGAHNRKFEIDGWVYQVQRNTGRKGTVLEKLYPVQESTPQPESDLLAAD